MNQDNVKGTWDKTKGKVNEEVGHATGNTSQEIKGVAQQVKGKIEKGIDELKDAAKTKFDRATDKNPK